MTASLKFIPPQEPTLAGSPPEGDSWQHEIKYDGYRTQVVIDGPDLRAFTKRGHDWSSHYQTILQSIASAGISRAIIDGEMIVQDELGRSDFYAFRSALHRDPARLIFMAFDLLHLDDLDLREQPLDDRRARLRDLLGDHNPRSRFQFSDHQIGNGPALFDAVDRMNLEGIVSKKRTSRYRSGPSQSWLKIKCFETAEFVVIAVDRSTTPATALLARENGDNLSFAGGAMITLTEADRNSFWARVRRLAANSAPLPLPPMKVEWLKPEFRVRAKFLKGSGRLRHATLVGIV